MNVLRAIISEFIGLFIDDGLLATAVALLAVLVGLVAPVAGIPAVGRAALLFVGLAVILVESVLRGARSS